VLGNNYYENGRVRAQLFWLKILVWEGQHVSAPLLGHHQVTKNILRGNYVGGRIAVRVILQRDLFVTFVAKISRVIAKHPPIKVLNLQYVNRRNRNINGFTCEEMNVFCTLNCTEPSAR
jgi:hypothetical protein